MAIVALNIMKVGNESIPVAVATVRSAPLSVNRRALCAAATALVAVVAANLLDIQGDHFSVALLNANWQFSWSHDLDTLILAAGLLAAVAGARNADEHAQLWWAVAVILALFVIDEASPLHRHVDELRIHHFALGKTLYSPILAALALCVWRLATRTDQRTTVGIGLLTLCACFAMHVLVLYLLRPLGYYNGIYQLGVGVKEGTELAGLFLVVLGLARLARRQAERASSSLLI